MESTEDRATATKKQTDFSNHLKDLGLNIKQEMLSHNTIKC